jgi:HEAT repeat protein
MHRYATALRSNDLSQRRAAIQELCRLGDVVPVSALDTLISLLQDEDEEVRDGATEALTNMAQGPNSDRVVPRLADLLVHPESIIRMRAVGIVSRVGPSAAPLIPLLIEGLNNKNRIFCRLSAEALVKIGPAAVPAVQAAFTGPEATVRMAAQWILNKLHEKPADDNDTMIESAKQPTSASITVPPQAEAASATATLAPAQAKGADRRTGRRFACTCDVFYQVMTSRTDDLWWKAKIFDVSAGGAGLILHASVAVGARLCVDLSEAHQGVERRAIARVVHCRQCSEGWSVGCAWIGNLDNEQLALLREALHAE